MRENGLNQGLKCSASIQFCYDERRKKEGVHYQVFLEMIDQINDALLPLALEKSCLRINILWLTLVPTHTTLKCVRIQVRMRREKGVKMIFRSLLDFSAGSG